MQTQDAELISAYLVGERAAVETVDGWITRAARPYQRRLASHWDDVLQDVRLELMRLLRDGRFRGESSFKTYLWRVVSHTCLDQIRAAGRWRWTDLEELDLGLPLAASPRRHESKDLLLRVLEETSEACRRLWTMILEGWSYREMSDELGVKEGALRVRVLRCRQRALEIRRRLLTADGV